MSGSVKITGHFKNKWQCFLLIISVVGNGAACVAWSTNKFWLTQVICESSQNKKQPRVRTAIILLSEKQTVLCSFYEKKRHNINIQKRVSGNELKMHHCTEHKQRTTRFNDITNEPAKDNVRRGKTRREHAPQRVRLIACKPSQMPSIAKPWSNFINPLELQKDN